jgi:hypothetical protein
MMIKLDVVAAAVEKAVKLVIIANVTNPELTIAADLDAVDILSRCGNRQ